MKSILLYSFLFTLVVTCSVSGQVIKRALTRDDYKLWSKIEAEQISDAGQWVSYSLRYESGKDTLFVRHTKSHKTYSIAGGTDGHFAAEHHFVCMTSGGKLIQISLNDGKLDLIADALSYTITAEGKTLMVMCHNSNGTTELLLIDLVKHKKLMLPNVTSYSYNAKSTALVYVVDSVLQMLFPDEHRTKSIVIDSTKRKYSDFKWQQNGTSVTYFIGDTLNKIGYYRVKERALYVFDPSEYANFPENGMLYNSSFTALMISDDGKRLFFGVKTPITDNHAKDVQVWNAEDKVLYPEKIAQHGWEALPKVAVWQPQEKQFGIITTTEFPQLMLTGDQKYALVFNPNANEPQFDRSAPIDFYLKNLDNDQQQLLIANQSPDVNKLSVSPSGRYIAYFKSKYWWLYDIATGKERNLTGSLNVRFENEDYNNSGESEVSGLAGWTENDAAILLYDTYDVWEVNLNDNNFRRLTNGREQRVKYRIIPQSTLNNAVINFTWMRKGIFNLADGLVLSARSDTKSGYFRWSRGKGLQEIAFAAKRLSNLKLSKNTKVCLYIDEHYHQSPTLKVQFKNETKAKVLFESNPQQRHYQWGFSRLITYTNVKGQLLKGALFYPADFKAENRYPMVVHIYERMAGYYNQYVNPSMLDSTGFTITNFTSKGYFVLLPDIVYEEGDTGQCALDCVLSACKEVLENESVDPKRIGILGHSFGGYETNYIITQTNFFAAAVSGAGIADLVSEYLYVGWNTSKPNFWRFEFNQFRIGGSLFDKRELYIRNSPINYAESITTPLLLWTGENDRQVNYYQSFEFHLALRRLKKPNILLLYEGERHSITQEQHQIDLTQRVESWFDYYLKGNPKPSWLHPDTF